LEIKGDDLENFAFQISTDDNSASKSIITTTPDSTTTLSSTLEPSFTNANSTSNSTQPTASIATNTSIPPSDYFDTLILVYILVPLGVLLIILLVVFLVFRFRNPSIPKFKDPEQIELNYSKKKKLEEFEKFSVDL